MNSSLIKLHISVFLAGFTGVLGVLIHLNEGILVWYRIMISALVLYIWHFWNNKFVNISIKNVWKLLGIGSLIALHWVCFYGSIKAANVSIGLVCFASVGLFTAILEPWLTKKKINWIEISLGMISLLGIYLIFEFDFRYRTGILIGITSSLLAALFSVLNKKNVNVAPAKTIMLYELSGGLLILSLLMPVYLHFFPTNSIFPTLSDWGWLMVLSLLCTVLGLDLMLQALKKVSAFTQNLIFNLEPVYGIVLAFLLFQENKQLTGSFYLGISLITLSVLLQMARMAWGVRGLEWLNRVKRVK